MKINPGSSHLAPQLLQHHPSCTKLYHHPQLIGPNHSIVRRQPLVYLAFSAHDPAIALRPLISISPIIFPLHCTRHIDTTSLFSEVDSPFWQRIGGDVICTLHCGLLDFASPFFINTRRGSRPVRTPAFLHLAHRAQTPALVGREHLDIA